MFLLVIFFLFVTLGSILLLPFIRMSLNNADHCVILKTVVTKIYDSITDREYPGVL